MFNTVLNTTLELHARDHLPIQAKKFFAENVFRYIHCRYHIRKLFYMIVVSVMKKFKSKKNEKQCFALYTFYISATFFL